MNKLKPHSQSFYTDEYINLKVHLIPCRSDNYSFVLETKNKTALMIDSSLKEPVLSFLEKEKLSLKAILLTHHHFDHVDGVEEFQKAYNCPIYCSEIDSNRGVFNGDHTVINEGSKLKIEGLEIETLETPGHTKSHLNFYLPNQDLLFCGDTLFSLGCGRVLEHFEKPYESFYQSLQKIKNCCTPDTKLYCAHEYTAANFKFLKSQNLVSDQLIKDLNIKVKGASRSVPTDFTFEMKHNAFLKSLSVSDFKTLREAKDQF